VAAALWRRGVAGSWRSGNGGIDAYTSGKRRYNSAVTLKSASDDIR